MNLNRPVDPSGNSKQSLSYLNNERTLKSWLLTTDHKRIAIMYMIAITIFFGVGASAAGMIRFELLSPYGIAISNETYNKMFTAHGIVMIFMFLVPSIPAVFGNFFVPLMIGAKDLAFPRLNLASFYIFIAGSLCVLWAILFGGIDTGWTFYTPFSSLYSSTQVTSAVVGIFIIGFSTIFTGVNFIATIHMMRAPGLTWFKLPLFVWSMYATAIIMVLSTPVISITLALVAVERIFHVGIFSPELGGDPVLFQHFFWFYSHPVVYIMIIPAQGVISELVPVFSRKRIFGYYVVAGSTIAIAVFSFLVWGHHMFISSMSVESAYVFSLFSFMVAIPSAIKVFNWIATMRLGRIYLDTPMLYAMGFIGLFTMGGLTGLFQATLATDVHLSNTYWIVAHFHYIMVGGSVMGYMGAMHYWWPKMFGRRYPEYWGKASALTTYLGFNLTFFPQFILGWLGMPRRYHLYAYAPNLQMWNVLSTAGATILGVGYVLPFVYLIWSLKYGEKASDNPWGAPGLEWQTATPPPKHNFERTPVVIDAPYVFSDLDRDEYKGAEDSILGEPEDNEENKEEAYLG